MWRNDMTDHGYERVKERSKGNGGKKIEEKVHRIWEHGKTIDDYADQPRFQKYLLNVKSAGDPTNELRVHGNEIYVFSSNGVLITVLNIPEKIRAQRGRVNKH